jgi:beta-phosphoglucomutase-like phosphatase (HAD superfamily)
MRPIVSARSDSDSPSAVLLDVDGTLLDTLPNLSRVWTSWALRHDLDVELVWQTALVTSPLQAFATVSPTLDPARCLEELHEIEDDDARNGDYAAYDGASLALEDGESGIAAARRAGLTVWAVNANSDSPGVENANRVYPTLKLASEDVIRWLAAR